MSLFQQSSTDAGFPPSAGAAWEQPAFGYQQPPYGMPAYAGQQPYGEGHMPPHSPPRRRVPVRIGEILMAVGGLLFFVAGFLTWVSFSFGRVFDTSVVCSNIPDLDARASCEASQAPTGAAATDGWDLVLTSVAGIVMFLLAATAAAVVARLVASTRVTLKCLAVGLVVVDVIGLLFFSHYDYGSLQATLSYEALAAEFGSVRPGLGDVGSGYSLGIGFWLALAGLLVAHVGLALAHRQARVAEQPAR